MKRLGPVLTFSPSIAWASPRKYSGQVFSQLSCTQPGGTGCHFPSGWRIFYIPRPPTLRTSGHSLAYTELVEVLAHATEKLSLDWSDEPRESQSSKLDERFLSGSGSRLTRRKLPFFPDMHYEVSMSWKQPFSSRLTNVVAADFTNPIDSLEQGNATVPAVEDTLAAYFSPNSTPSWKRATYGWISWRRLSSSTPRSSALACSATQFTPSSISSGLLKRSQLRMRIPRLQQYVQLHRPEQPSITYLTLAFSFSMRLKSILKIHQLSKNLGFVLA